MQYRNSKTSAAKCKIANTPSPSTEEEVENVEYLDECVIDDNEDDITVGSSQQHLTVDTFYPNAVHCLISLYRDRYEKQMNDLSKVQHLKTKIWECISKDMHECYFKFDAQQVQHKYTQLRSQYFSVSSKKDAEVFDYFQPLHEIYNDNLISSILNCDSSIGTACSRKLPGCKRIIYRDEELFSSCKLDNRISVDKETNSKESSIKVNELKDSLERKQRTNDDSNQVEPKEEITFSKNSYKRNRNELLETDDISLSSLKRTKCAVNATTAPPDGSPDDELKEGIQ